MSNEFYTCLHNKPLNNLEDCQRNLKPKMFPAHKYFQPQSFYIYSYFEIRNFLTIQVIFLS
jgi:hypothetical protein